MSTALRVLLDTPKPSEVLAALCRRLHVPCVISPRLYAELVAELGSDEAAAAFLVDLSKRLDKPLLLNLKTAEGSTTVALAPPSWSRERLAGYLGGLHQELEAMFGPAELWGMKP